MRELRIAEEQLMLAAEQTYASWIRTGLAALGSGIAIIRLIVFKTMETAVVGHITGLLLILWGILLFVYAFIRYKNVSKLIPVVDHVHTARGIASITFLLLIISLLLFWLNLRHIHYL